MPREITSGFWKSEPGLTDFAFWWAVYDDFPRAILNLSTPDPIGVALAISEPLARATVAVTDGSLDLDYLIWRMSLLGFSRVVIEVSEIEVVNYVSVGASVAHFLAYRSAGGVDNPAGVGRRGDGVVGTIR